MNQQPEWLRSPGWQRAFDREQDPGLAGGCPEVRGWYSRKTKVHSHEDGKPYILWTREDYLFGQTLW